MNPMLKRLIAAIAIKKAIDKIRDAREPEKPSTWKRARKLLVVAGTGAAAYYLYSTGKLEDVVERVRGRRAAHSPEYPSTETAT